MNRKLLTGVGVAGGVLVLVGIVLIVVSASTGTSSGDLSNIGHSIGVKCAGAYSHMKLLAVVERAVRLQGATALNVRAVLRVYTSAPFVCVLAPTTCQCVTIRRDDSTISPRFAMPC